MRPEEETLLERTTKVLQSPPTFQKHLGRWTGYIYLFILMDKSKKINHYLIVGTHKFVSRLDLSLSPVSLLLV